MPPERRRLPAEPSAQPGQGARLRLHPTPAGVRAALANISNGWAAAGIEDDLRGRAELVLAEALNNVVEHAMAGRPGGVIEIETVAAADGLMLWLRDDGGPMPGDGLPPGGLPRPGRDLPEGGFGWYLIRQLSDGTSYRRERGRNHLTIRIAPRAAWPG